MTTHFKVEPKYRTRGDLTSFPYTPFMA